MAGPNRREFLRTSGLVTRITHMQKNMGAAQGILPDQAIHAKMLGYFQSL